MRLTVGRPVARSVRKCRPEGQTQIDKGAAAHVDARATDVAIGDGEGTQAAYPHRTLQPQRALEAHTAAKAEIKPTQVQPDGAGGIVHRPAVARV